MNPPISSNHRGWTNQCKVTLGVNPNLHRARKTFKKKSWNPKEQFEHDTQASYLVSCTVILCGGNKFWTRKRVKLLRESVLCTWTKYKCWELIQFDCNLKSHTIWFVKVKLDWNLWALTSGVLSHQQHYGWFCNKANCQTRIGVLN